MTYVGKWLSRNTPVIPYTRPPVSTDSAIRDWLRDCRNLQQSTIIYYILPCSAIFCYILPTCFYCDIYNIRNVRDFCRILPSLLNSAKFCQDHDPKPILPHTRVNRATKSIIYTLSSCFLISFPYVMSWLHHTVHVRSLIISTSLYIIATRTHSVI